ncbi:mechanosensitive ion channel family protein [Cohnella sp.]|uniref:mechanosensitive ion channel family protein n=1 Tax=Cohnella sp. TaxID=1883426 RepID=UPI003566DABB
MLLDWLMEVSDAIRWKDLSIAVGIMVLFLLFRKLFARYIYKFIVKKFSGSEGAVNWALAFEKPLRLFFVIMGVYMAFKYYVPQNWEYTPDINRICRSLGIIAAGWGIYNLSASSSVLLEGISKRFGLDDTSMLIPFLSKILRFIVVVLILTIVGSEWGFSINGLVAGMGLGSLAIALAAKDTLGNILGGIVIILEKPFSKGDWILTPSTEGVVEDITFRSSKIRTFADAIVTVPNATLADQPITNWSKMGKRRISFTLDVALDSERDRLAVAIARIEDELRRDEAIDQETIMVKFSDFKESSLGIFLYFFTSTTVWSEYLAARQDSNLMIMRVLEEEGIRLAVPVRRVLVEDSASERYKGLLEEG